MRILVTGGTGFIGSHTVVELLLDGHDVVIVDNLSNSEKSVVDAIEKITQIRPLFYEVDVTDQHKMDEIFKKHPFDGIIHFAGYKAVGESVEKPLVYYYNNVLSTIILSELALKYHINKFVFSSSATVYGDQEPPFIETMSLGDTTNPYGETKKISERILSDTANVNPNFHVTLLRYFNPIGAHPSGLIGENPNGIPNNLMPFITKVAKGMYKELKIFGNDYDTVDGTGVRDYIHVVDLAKGHLEAIKHMKHHLNIYNLGTGKGTSVLELVNAFMEVNKINIPYRIVERRPGDIASSYANVNKAYEELKWKTKLDTKDMVKDAWHFENMKDYTITK